MICDCESLLVLVGQCTLRDIWRELKTKKEWLLVAPQATLNMRLWCSPNFLLHEFNRPELSLLTWTVDPVSRCIISFAGTQTLLMNLGMSMPRDFLNGHALRSQFNSIDIFISFCILFLSENFVIVWVWNYCIVCTSCINHRTDVCTLIRALHHTWGRCKGPCNMWGPHSTVDNMLVICKCC